MNIKRMTIVPLVFIGLFLLFTVLAFNTRNVSSETVTNNVCANGASLLFNGSLATSAVIPGSAIAQLSVNTTSTDAPLITRVQFYMNETIPLGKGVNEINYQWSMPWVVGLAPLDTTQPARITAKIFYNDSATGTTTSCLVPTPVYVTIEGTRPSSMSVAVTPGNWSGPMSYSVNFVSATQVQSPQFDPSPYALYEWATTLGSVNPLTTKNTQLTSGTTAGTGTVKLKVMYGGAVKEVLVPITVKAPDAPLPAPNQNNTTTSPSTDPTKTTTTQTTTNNTTKPILAIPTVQNPTAQDCIVSAIGEARFTEINTGKSRPTFEEIEKIKTCFAASNYIVPSNFAPVAPTGINKLPVTKAVEISNPVNEKKVVDNVEKNVLRFSGKAEPNSIVFLYIFSDPLVLTTRSDGNGNWEYVLEDPIEPGEHEVYTVVNRGDGVYERTEVLSFKLDATAEAATQNPNGLTLKLANATPAQSQRSLNLYIAGSITVLAFAVAAFVFTLLHKNRATSKSNATFSAFPAEKMNGTEPAITVQPADNANNEITPMVITPISVQNDTTEQNQQ